MGTDLSLSPPAWWQKGSGLVPAPGQFKREKFHPPVTAFGHLVKQPFVSPAWLRYLLPMPRASLFLCLLTAALVAAAVAIAAGEAERNYYPDGYRHWAVAKIKFIGPENPGWDAQGGLRLHFANQTALESWGKFREGSVIVDERLHTRLQPRKVWEETGPAHVAVMRKDSRFKDTGGWYFNVFVDGDTAVGLTHDQARTRCFQACHQAQEARDFVFSDPRL